MQNISVYQQQSLEARSQVSLWDVIRILWRNLWVIVLCMGVSLIAAYYISRHTPKQWRGTAQVIVLQIMPAVSAGNSRTASTAMVESTETQVAMLQSLSMAQRTINLLKNRALAQGRSTVDIPNDPEAFQKTISVLVPKETNLIDVTLEADSQEHARVWADGVCQAFEDWKKEVAQKNFADTIASLEGRAARAKAQMLETEQQEMTYKQNHHMVDIPIQQREALGQFQAREAEVETAGQELKIQTAKLNALQQRLQEVNAAIKTTVLTNAAGVRDDSEVLRLQSQLNQLESERASLAQRFTPLFPGILPDTDAKIADTRRRLAAAVQGILDNKLPSLQGQGTLLEEYKQAQVSLMYTQAKFTGLTQLRDRLHAQLANLPVVSMEYARLARNTELTRSLNSSIQEAVNTARIDQDMASGNIQISQKAYVGNKPIRPNLVRDMLFGAAAGLFLSLIGVFTLEQSDRRIRTVGRARELAAGPVIGALPKLSRTKLRQLQDGTFSPQVVEAYNLARANLLLAISDNTAHLASGHIILITSTVPGEGKSLTAAHLARALARGGKTVILVDADMRRPTQNTLFNTQEPHGLADVLTGNLSLAAALVSSDTEGLSVLHSGSPQENPSDLLARPRMKQTLDLLRQEADIVLIDTPATSVVADALLLASWADSILNIIGIGLVNDVIVQASATALKMASATNLVYFVNRAPKEHSDGNRRYYAEYYKAKPLLSAQPPAAAESPSLLPVDDPPESS